MLRNNLWARFQRGGKLTSPLPKQHLLRALNGTKPPCPWEGSQILEGNCPHLGTVCVHLGSKHVMNLFTSFFSFLLSSSSFVLSLHSQLQPANPNSQSVKKCIFTTGRLFIVGPVSNCHECFWLLGNELLKITNHLVTTKSHISILVQSNSTFVSREMLSLGEEDKAEQDE